MAAYDGGKALAAGSTIKQVATFILAILAANKNIALTAQAAIIALVVGTEKTAHARS